MSEIARLQTDRFALVAIIYIFSFALQTNELNIFHLLTFLAISLTLLQETQLVAIVTVD
jgi:hypothetical protein